jgi:hypothetical protein
MWIIHEPKKGALWNKRHFEDKNGECAACLKYLYLLKNIYKMQHLEGSGMPVLYIGRTVLKGQCPHYKISSTQLQQKSSPGGGVPQTCTHYTSSCTRNKFFGNELKHEQDIWNLERMSPNLVCTFRFNKNRTVISETKTMWETRGQILKHLTVMCLSKENVILIISQASALLPHVTAYT